MNFDPYTGKPIKPGEAPWWRRNLWAIIACAALFLVGIAIGASGGNSDKTASATVTITTGGGTVTVTDSTATTNDSTAAESSATTDESSTPSTDSWTASQQNAVGSAEDYLRTQSFSKSGLIKQLSSKYGDGFPKKDAIFAVNHIKVNWNQQAAKAAKEYLSEQSFSRDGLIQQLESQYGDGFTHAQAVYGVNRTGL